MKIRQGFVSNSSSASFLVAIKTEIEDLFKKRFLEASADCGPGEATLDYEGKEELLANYDKHIQRKWEDLARTLQNHLKALDRLQAEKEEIANYPEDWKLMELTFYDGYSKSGQVLEEYIEKKEAIKIRRA